MSARWLPNGFHTIFDTLADALTGSIAAAAGGARIDRGTTEAGAVLCHVRSDAQRADYNGTTYDDHTTT